MRYHATALALALAIAPGLLTSRAGAQEPQEETAPAERAESKKPETCLDCHDDLHRVPSDRLIGKALAGSVHADEDCTNCHQDFSMEDLDLKAKNPHGKEAARVNCAECHEEAAKVYTKHGLLEVSAGDPDTPTCASCHGTHDIRRRSDPLSRVHPDNLPEVCKSCHTDTDVVDKHHALRDEPIRLYESSVHGTAQRRGLTLAASCVDCHGAKGAAGEPTAHRILGPGDNDSPIFYFNIPNTCGQCHVGIVEEYWAGIHGQLVKRGEVAAPNCTRCHGEHGILAPSDLRSPVSAARLAEDTCAPCHESEVLNERYGIPSGRLKSYVDSYHGLKRKAGSVHVANCASCHGHHMILPHTDPRSSIHPENLQRTCGDCHPGISKVLATTPIHATATGMRSGWAAFFTTFYQVLIVLVVGGMVLHNLAHWYRHLLKRREGEFVIRMSANETAQHWVLMISFITLVISGFALRFSEAWWVELLFGWGGGEGFLMRGLIHRAAATVFGLWSVWHLVYLFTRRGRGFMRDMIAGREDLRHLMENLRYFLGRRAEPPRFKRYSYIEKCEYWALIWGTVIMIATGLLLWFDNFFIESLRLPKGLLDVALVIHYYEAWLATLAIAVWHLYSTIFSPSIYPMNMAWWAGRMPKELYAEEHPDGPPLKGRTRVPDYAEELERE